MKKLKLYLETSVWNFCFADDAPEKRDITLKFFDEIESEDYEIFISGIVLQEIDESDYEKRALLLETIEKYNPENLIINEKVSLLAREYISEGILSVNSFEDAVHAALATVYEMDALISWNLKHLANLRKMERINDVNRNKGYFKRLELITPMEVSNAEI
jgi:predicted nucleic acid-binding protein